MPKRKLNISSLKRNIKKNLNNLFLAKNSNLKFTITIDPWYGRLGNNIQQIALAIMYAKKKFFRVKTPEHNSIASISLGKKGFCGDKIKIKNRFFFFSDPKKCESDIALSYEYVCANIQKIAQEYITPNFKFRVAEPFNENVLVIHLRGGDIFKKEGNAHPEYVQNPLSFYQNLIKNFKKTILVYEPVNESPIVSILKNLPSVTVQSSSIESDFATLLRAKNLATSGVGTFAVAAALCSKNLKNLFCTNLYLTIHLNPEMITDANVHCLRLQNDYIKIGSWDGGSIETISLMLNYQVDKEFFKNIFENSTRQKLF
jgi:hypothetical protein